jgi:hypothetical protein
MNLSTFASNSFKISSFDLFPCASNAFVAIPGTARIDSPAAKPTLLAKKILLPKTFGSELAKSSFTLSFEFIFLSFLTLRTSLPARRIRHRSLSSFTIEMILMLNGGAVKLLNYCGDSLAIVSPLAAKLECPLGT